jgi:hypothetical protein
LILNRRFFALIVKFLGVIMTRAQTFGIDWGQSMAGSAMIPGESRVILRIIGAKVTFAVEFVIESIASLNQPDPNHVQIHFDLGKSASIWHSKLDGLTRVSVVIWSEFVSGVGEVR